MQKTTGRIFLRFQAFDFFVIFHDSGLQSIWTLLYVGRICAILSSYCSFDVLHGETIFTFYDYFNIFFAGLGLHTKAICTNEK